MFDDDAVMPEAPVPPVAPALAPNDPVVEPFAVPVEMDPIEDDDPVGKGDVGTLSGSEPTWLPPVEVVCAWAVVMPKTMIAIKKSGRIAFLLRSSREAGQRVTAQKVQMKLWKGGRGG